MQTTIGDALGLVLYVGAARADATPEQVEPLRAALSPVLEVYRETGDEQPVRRAVVSVLGEQWEPSGEWKQRIDAL